MDVEGVTRLFCGAAAVTLGVCCTKGAGDANTFATTGGGGSPGLHFETFKPEPFAVLDARGAQGSTPPWLFGT